MNELLSDDGPYDVEEIKSADRLGPALSTAAFAVFIFCLVALMIGGTVKVFTIWF